MILPIVSAISREVIATVPSEHKEAALALGATRWEMIRIAVLPYARPGITGGAMLGLGRAIGETIAVVLRDRQLDDIGIRLFEQGQSLAGVIANAVRRGARRRRCHSRRCSPRVSILFVLTLVVNIIARRFIRPGTAGISGGGEPRRSHRN